MLRDLPTELLPLTDEQQAIVDAARQLRRARDSADRPRGRRGRHRDALGDLAQGRQGRVDGFHASGGVRRRRVHRHVQPVPGARRCAPETPASAI